MRPPKRGRRRVCCGTAEASAAAPAAGPYKKERQTAVLGAVLIGEPAAAAQALGSEGLGQVAWMAFPPWGIEG
ncbi:MAG TPA: hypothetical protein VIP57_18015 [Candidatus Dormibacteraeota bacterium]